jgi:hypothetical protein
MPLIYGEGEDHAMKHLLKEIEEPENAKSHQNQILTSAQHALLYSSFTTSSRI